MLSISISYRNLPIHLPVANSLPKSRWNHPSQRARITHADIVITLITTNWWVLSWKRTRGKYFKTGCIFSLSFCSFEGIVISFNDCFRLSNCFNGTLQKEQVYINDYQSMRSWSYYDHLNKVLEDLWNPLKAHVN